MCCPGARVRFQRRVRAGEVSASEAGTAKCAGAVVVSCHRAQQAWQRTPHVAACALRWPDPKGPGHIAGHCSVPDQTTSGALLDSTARSFYRYTNIIV